MGTLPKNHQTASAEWPSFAWWAAAAALEQAEGAEVDTPHARPRAAASRMQPPPEEEGEHVREQRDARAG